MQQCESCNLSGVDTRVMPCPKCGHSSAAPAALVKAPDDAYPRHPIVDADQEARIRAQVVGESQ